MATTSPKTTTRRSPPSASPTPSPITRGATARSAASPRTPSTLTPAASRRPLSKGPAINGETREFLSASLKQETDQKEQLLVKLQNRDQTISGLTTDNDNLTSALNAAEARVNELYAEQSRSEMELAQRIDISEKLRAQVRELEKEKRDLQRRYNEQTATFEAERQAFYDNEQHLKSRIQSLTQALKRSGPPLTPVDTENAEPDSEVELDSEEDALRSHTDVEVPPQDINDPESEPAEMTALKLELSTLSTSYSSLQSTLVLLQTQLVDLKRVNQELQEENESYMILLREKTLSGQFDLMKQVGGSRISDDEDDDDDDEDQDDGSAADVGSLRSIGRSTLDRVDEESGESLQYLHESVDLDQGLLSSSRSSRHPSRQGRKRTLSNNAPRGESLADLPITGPGLDLAAELGRAENKDILTSDSIDDRDRSLPKGKRSKKGTDGRKVSGSDPLLPEAGNDIDALRTEVKSLKDANKALSLYASKIIDRIIAQEGFEHVLAIDYDKEPRTPATAGPHSIPPKLPPTQPKPRPQSVIVGRSTSNPNPAINTQLTSPNLTKPPNPKTQRRSMSFDWKSFSFGEKKVEPNLRPLTLKPGASPVTGARKLETFEDEEDRKERERLNATMKLMGIQPAAQSPLHAPPTLNREANNNRRISLFGTRSNSEASSHQSTSSSELAGNAHVGLGFSPGLTHEALERAEAENSLAALDAHERGLSADIARGASGGFTEITPRSLGRRSRRSAGGSGSTVWSAGMSGEAGED
ncbi:uncharacterized protein LACBIDRAFT_300760 [Laccaria bicolor S238N-H82]|uniref:Predicted protein n=1 Tax=Laccaria bicolor (strain S238N-H82 / ATCC MYA-4686) TaxID=486041 RepID=B0CQG5_LACBS|nr:uncharacterized protein LACBIDRAFT_300760 [Laccaria bicolor S238N-H82]EDR15031.1 predicted protein [Laccaria bicolor S238N-H82]|eukprot:XP_001873239.1 predicted protein [Laccaria bicolor S238N-H82]